MKKNAVKYIAIIAVCVLAELLLSNFGAVSLRLSGAESTSLSLSSASIIASGSASGSADGIELSKGKVTFENVGSEMKNICVEVEDEECRYMTVDVTFTDDNFSKKSGAWQNSHTARIYLGPHEKNYINVSAFGKVGMLRLDFTDYNTNPFTITSVKLNEVPPPAFHPLRFLVMLAVVFAAVKGLWRVKFGNSDSILIMLGAAVLCVIVLAFPFALSRTPEYRLLADYPLEDKYTSDQYQQLTSAFREGRLNINVDCDEAQFSALENPYDISERDAVGAKGDFWDRAYYNGQFYSYFGVAPVFTVYYPILLITGKLPVARLASAIVTCYAIIFLSLLYSLILRRFLKDVPLIPALLGQYALIFGSMILPLNAEEIFYSIAVISGIGALAAFLYFLLTAYYEESFRKRLVFLALAGVFTVGIAGSRPSLLIYTAAALVPAFFIFRSREEKTGRKLAYTAAIGVPVVVGAAGLMAYNAARFGSPFEFGFSYQLTVSSAAANTLTLAYIPAAVYHYFLEQPEYSTTFPYLDINWHNLGAYPRYTFVHCSVGAFAFPAAWGVLLYPAKSRKDDSFRRAFELTLLSAAILLSFIDMCKAGALYRYTADIMIPILLIGLIAVFDVLAMMKDAPKRAYVTAYILAVLALAATIVAGFLLIFSNEYEYYLTTFASITQMLRKL